MKLILIGKHTNSQNHNQVPANTVGEYRKNALTKATKNDPIFTRIVAALLIALLEFTNAGLAIELKPVIPLSIVPPVAISSDVKIVIHNITVPIIQDCFMDYLPLWGII